ncbi:MAG: DUF2442 domain-containing protein [Planctomycetota bacterium]
MVPKLVAAQYIDRYRIRLTYDNGTEGEVDLENELWGNVFEPLKDIEKFKAFRFDEELRTIVWPNGADLAPEFLYERATE